MTLSICLAETSGSATTRNYTSSSSLTHCSSIETSLLTHMDLNPRTELSYSYGLIYFVSTIRFTTGAGKV